MQGGDTRRREDLMNLAIKLRRLRESAGMTQPEVARISGVGVKTISSFETGQRIDSIKVSQFVALCKAYGVSAARLLDDAQPAGDDLFTD
jgi:transcriptional regulator with XRE-family HTH domain